MYQLGTIKFIINSNSFISKHNLCRAMPRCSSPGDGEGVWSSRSPLRRSAGCWHTAKLTAPRGRGRPAALTLPGRCQCFTHPWEWRLMGAGDASCQPGESSAGLSGVDGDLHDLLAQVREHALSPPRCVTRLGTHSTDAWLQRDASPAFSHCIFCVSGKAGGEQGSCWAPAWRT